MLGHRLESLQPVLTKALNPPPHGDGLLMLLGALALAVLVFASSMLLRLLARDGGGRWGRPAS
jgi:hypothetical protein